MFKGAYFLRARLFPALLTSIPMLVFINSLVAVRFANEFAQVSAIIPLLSQLGLLTAVVFLCVQINRVIAKELFQRIYFKEELRMPTTNHLLYNNTHYTNIEKDRIRQKIESRFSITLPDLQQENTDEIGTRKELASAVSLVRIALKDNGMLLRHNIEYGFWRNLIGGSVLSVAFSIAILVSGYLSKNTNLATLGMAFTILYLLPILFSKFIINRYGKYYAKILFEQFVALP